MVVMYMRYFFILTVVFSFSALAEKDLREVDLVKLHVSPNQDAKIFSFHGTPDVFTLKNLKREFLKNLNSLVMTISMQ